MNGMKFVRRVHLYAGLFLAPWVAMYGISGLIFNHGNWFAPGDSDATSPPVEWSMESTALPPWPAPAALAQKVIAALNAAEQDKPGATEYRLSPEGTPQLRGRLSLQGQNQGGGSVFLSFDRHERKGTTSHSPPGPPEVQVTLATNEAPLLHATKTAMLAAAAKVDAKLSTTKWTGDDDIPRLTFPIEHANERRAATYDLRSGVVTISPASQPMRVPQFLTSLHVSHGYPSETKSAKMLAIRAVFVDAMGFLMCFWAVSGIAMWLQLKPQRRWGIAVAIASVFATVIVWSAMYRFFTE